MDSFIFPLFACFSPTAKVLDWQTASRTCKQCESLDADGDQESEEWQQRKNAHDEFCMRNHAGSAKSMECDGAEILWSRSVDDLKLRYTTFVGDSSSFGRVDRIQPYGPDHPIVKEDCVGHVQKRMGTGLRELLKTNKGKKLPPDMKGISGRNRLTKKRIDTMQVFYGKAIRNNIGNVHGAHEAVLAILEHCASTDEHPRHHLCPKGEDSWCSWQRAQVTKTFHKHKNPLPVAIRRAVEPLFMRLAEPSLLEKCNQGLTQNLNEALHSLIWRLAPKHTFHSPVDVYMASALAVGVFNDGMAFLEGVLNELGLQASDHALAGLKKKDERRHRTAKKRSQPEWKEAQKKKRRHQLGIEEQTEEQAGPTYEPGLFGPDGQLTSLPTSIGHDEEEPPAKKARTCRKKRALVSRARDLGKDTGEARGAHLTDCLN